MIIDFQNQQYIALYGVYKPTNNHSNILKTVDVMTPSLRKCQILLVFLAKAKELSFYISVYISQSIYIYSFLSISGDQQRFEEAVLKKKKSMNNLGLKKTDENQNASPLESLNWRYPKQTHNFKIPVELRITMQETKRTSH